MAYAFDKVDDYFRRNKQGGQGSLQRGTTGAPPPTAAAESVAKAAETSAEMGNADTSAFRANQGASQAAAQSALTQPAQRQAQAWEQGEQKKAGEFKAEGEKNIGETYKPWNPADLSGIESGNQEAMQRGREQVGYTGKEMTFQPYQASAPQLDTTSMLRGGVGGLQAALQKGKGGRYTAGMGALDASLMAGNKDAMQGLQAQLGDVYQGAREKKEQFEQTDEQLAKKALEQGTSTSKAAKEALKSRAGELRKLAEAQAKTEFDKQMSGIYGDEMNAIRAQQGLYNDAFGSKIGGTPFDLRQLMRPQGPSDEDVAYKMYAPVSQRNVSVAPQMGAGFTNISNVLGETPQASQALTGSGFGFDRNMVLQKGGAAGQDLMNRYRQMLQGGDYYGTWGPDSGVNAGVKNYIVTAPNGQQLLVTRDAAGVVRDVDRM
jgi:hypothetical protein